MLNKLQSFMRREKMLQQGDAVVCAVSGGADSMALLWAMYLLREKWDLHLSAAHFNHCLRGGESERDASFVKTFCQAYEIPLFYGTSAVTPGAKGLEAAARDARYGFLCSLPGKIATAHTADDNAETLLLHLVRGTGLKGLGGITPIRGNLIRPMLTVTREEILRFLEEYSIPFVEDSSNDTDAFLRNRLRHHVMPLLRQENPSLAENLSETALRLRKDEAALQAVMPVTNDVQQLREMLPAVRSRVLAQLLSDWGVAEPESEHIALLEQLVFSEKPSAMADFPRNVRIRRNYGVLEKAEIYADFVPVLLRCPGETELPELDLRVICSETPLFDPGVAAVRRKGNLIARGRQPGDKIRLPGGSKRLKELFIDRKIPAAIRSRIAVVCDEAGILAVQGIGPNLDRTESPDTWIRFETISDQQMLNK